MTPTKGYYSLVQFCPDASRLEAVNVGVVLFAPALHFIQARMSLGHDRVRRLFGNDAIDFDLLKAQKSAIAERVQAEAARFNELSDLERFIATRFSEVRLTAPRFVKVFSPENDLAALFNELVGGRTAKRADPSVKVELARAMGQSDVRSRILENYLVTIEAFRTKKVVPYGFLNGALNLIEPVRFSGLTHESLLNIACKYAIEGESVAQQKDPRFGKMRLFIVARFGKHQREEASTVRAMMEARKVKLFHSDQIGDLVTLIKQTGKPIPPDTRDSE